MCCTPRARDWPRYRPRPQWQRAMDEELASEKGVERHKEGCHVTGVNVGGVVTLTMQQTVRRGQ